MKRGHLILHARTHASIQSIVVSMDTIYHIMQIVCGGNLSWFSFQPRKFSSEFFYNKMFLGLKWQTVGQALDLAC